MYLFDIREEREGGALQKMNKFLLVFYKRKLLEKLVIS